VIFLAIPMGVEYRAQRYPVVTFTIMGLCTFSWLIETVLRLTGNNEPTEESIVPWFFQVFGLVPSDGRIHQWLTYMFVHGGFFHLLGNMIYLFLFGSCVEDILGRVRYAIFYVVGGVLAALAQIAFTASHFDSSLPIVGASGAISACMGAFVPLFLKTRIQFKYILWIIFYFWAGEFSIKSWIVMSWWFLKDVVAAILSYDAGGGTAFAAHAGGWASGLGLILIFKLLLKRGVVRSAAQEALEAEYRASDEPIVYLYDRGQQTGPFPVSQVTAMLRAGSISKEAVYWCDGMTEWKSVRDVVGGVEALKP
jgi:membrane associated rhomboid family serine protease